MNQVVREISCMSQYTTGSVKHLEWFVCAGRGEQCGGGGAADAVLHLTAWLQFLACQAEPYADNTQMC